MNEVALWTVALTAAVLGFLLLVIAGVAAALLRSRRIADQDPDMATSAEPHVQEATRGDSGGVVQDTPSSASPGSHILAWLQACVLASLHALVVSLVLGVVTFYEDIVQAQDEIRRTGSVSFPKNLLPGSIVAPYRHRLSNPEEDYSRYEAADDGFANLSQNDELTLEVMDWDVVTVSDETKPF